MESFENRRLPCIFLTVCDILASVFLNTLQLVDVETGQTLEERGAVIKVPDHSGIRRQQHSTDTALM